MTIENYKIIKIKRFTSGKSVVLFEATDTCIQLIYFEENDIKMAKSYFLGSLKKSRKKVMQMARKEFHIWLEIIWKNNYINYDSLMH